jgi:hypothetical protein
MSVNKQKKISYSLKELTIKMSVMIVTISIGLWCGWTDSYGSFYIAALVQAVNNLYESSSFLGGYTKFVTVFQFIAFCGALCSVIISIIHFTNGGTVVDNLRFVCLIIMLLSIPVLHFGIEIYNMIREGRY